MSNLQNSIKNATSKLAKALEDAAELRVETRYVLLSEPTADAKPDDNGRLLARTVMELGGDTTVVLPMTRNDAGELQTNKEIFDFHQKNVVTALEYRARLLSDLLGAIRSLG